MTEQTLIILVAAIAPTVASVSALIVAIINARKVDVVTAKVDDNTAKTTEISAKADVIHSLTNDSLSKATNALAVANETINGLKMLNASLTAKAVIPTEPTK